MYKVLAFIINYCYSYISEVFPNTIGSFYDQCSSKNGFAYVRDNGENGCYYFYSRLNSMEYSYNKSMEFCEGIDGASGYLPIIKGPKDNSNMLHLLNGYVSELP